METLLYSLAILILIMIGLGFANRIWIETGDWKLSIYSFFTWGMAIGDELARRCFVEDNPLKAECEFEDDVNQ